jgi:hypothetical protein
VRYVPSEDNAADGSTKKRWPERSSRRGATVYALSDGEGVLRNDEFAIVLFRNIAFAIILFGNNAFAIIPHRPDKRLQVHERNFRCKQFVIS